MAYLRHKQRAQSLPDLGSLIEGGVRGSQGGRQSVLALSPVLGPSPVDASTAERELATISEILDRALPIQSAPSIGSLLVRAQPSKAQASRLSAALIRAAAAFDRCRVSARDSRTRLVCESWSSRCFSALRSAEARLAEDYGRGRVDRYDAVDTLLSALFAAHGVLIALAEGADSATLADAAVGGHVSVFKALQAEAAPTAACREREPA